MAKTAMGELLKRLGSDDRGIYPERYVCVRKMGNLYIVDHLIEGSRRYFPHAKDVITYLQSDVAEDVRERTAEIVQFPMASPRSIA